jgi:CTP synthase (UTP-ammonia lyase)
VHRVRIAIVGDFDRGKHSHWATEAGLFHSAARVGVAVEPHWLPTPSVAADRTRLSGFDGIWGAPGSPFASADGMLASIEYARRGDLPYLGTCGGFQYALIEITRNVLGLLDADSAENDPHGKHIVITPIRCDVPNRSPAASRLSGEGAARPVSGTLLEKLCGTRDLRGDYFCSLEANSDFLPRWEAVGLRVSARGEDGEMRAFELRDHRFFVATLFRPQLSSSYERPHPIIDGYLRACAERGE